ncbi:hypothetical protein [Saprospira grandis]|uniref:hypothetical protein n=1 Tax=Saprospira grandis TaxID=1008 RepID=UPI0022DE1472|nr:hypothetical protein [Saprospira grandis]WBM74771.1 hypothetical protein OP864_00755 [Saprospira grandis]
MHKLLVFATKKGLAEAHTSTSPIILCINIFSHDLSVLSLGSPKLTFQTKKSKFCPYFSQKRKSLSSLSRIFYFFLFFLGLPLRFAWVGLCRSSQVCSALRFFSLRSKKLGLACGHCFLSLSRSSSFFRPLFFFGSFGFGFLDL